MMLMEINVCLMTETHLLNISMIIEEMFRKCGFNGLDGKLNEINEGYAGVKLNYDSIGNIIEYVTYV